MIAIVDYGAGNAASVARALARLGAAHRIVRDAGGVLAAERVILPGVGHFGALMRALDERGLRQPLLQFLASGRPFLGICVGLQALYAGSEEAPGVAGLGHWPGHIRRFPPSGKVPHVGWTEVTATLPSRLLAGGGAAPSFYFTHAYFAPPDACTVAVAYYPSPFAAVVESGAVFATQFHPEKSGDAGHRLLENFVSLPPGPASVSIGAAAPRRAPWRRIIPCLDVNAGRVVKGVRFAGLRDSGDPAALAAAYDEAGADELALLDVSASLERRATLLATVEAVARQLRIPFLVGGGVGSTADGERLLRAGADKVAVNSAAAARPELIAELAAAFGSQAVVAAIDARREGAGWHVYTHGGQRPAGRDALAWAREATANGAGEILLTSMDRDGTRDGFDRELTAAVAGAVSIPVIASGGGGTAADFAAVLAPGGADAALAASMFHDGGTTPQALKRALAQAGIAVRIQS
jgi:imidazole glycerol phosphate synthase glutamine amidotransferase subunit